MSGTSKFEVLQLTVPTRLCHFASFLYPGVVLSIPDYSGLLYLLVVKMWFLKALALSLLPLSTLCARSPPDSKFKRYFSKSTFPGPLQLDDGIYDDVTAAPRDYTVAVLLTALEARFGCQLCRDFQPEWDLIAKSWNRGDKGGQSRVLYGTLDFSEGKATFQKVRHR